MAQTKAIVDKLLTNVSSAYIPQGYISEMALPEIGVIQKTGKLGKYGTSHLRIENSIKGGRGEYRRVETITRSTTGYDVEGHGLEGLVSADDYRNVELPFDAERDETLGISTVLWLEKEKSLADTLGSTSILTQNTTLTGSDQYNDYLNSDPIDDFNTARASVKSGCGLPPDTAIMSWEVYNKLRFHSQILDALGYKFARPGGLEISELAVAMGVKRVLIGEASYESAKEGATSSLAPVWGKNVIFACLPSKAQQYQVSLGYLVKYSNMAPRQVFKYNVNNPPNSTGVLVEDNYDMLISNALAAYLIKNAIA